MQVKIQNGEKDSGKTTGTENKKEQGYCNTRGTKNEHRKMNKNTKSPEAMSHDSCFQIQHQCFYTVE